MKLFDGETCGSEIECPYCGFEYSDSWEWYSNRNDEWIDEDCEGCGKMFQAIRVISVDYYARPVTQPQEESVKTCICGEINARHCPIHNEGKSDEGT